jgi:arylsulfatase A-like enzyme
LASVRQRLKTARRLSWESGVVADQDELKLLSDLYDASLACADDLVGNLLEDLDRSGRAAETVVIVTADHGENIGDHGRTGHSMGLFQTLLQVPFIARVPGTPAARVSGLAQLTDVFAGLCGVLGLDAPPSLTARQFAADPFRMSDDSPGRSFAFAEWKERGRWESEKLARRKTKASFTSPPSMDAVQDRRYKLIAEVASGRQMLFDLKVDPDETRDRVQEAPDQAARLTQALEEWRARFRPAGEEAAYSAEEQKALEARLQELGYI